jgi:hypothetical protein
MLIPGRNGLWDKNVTHVREYLLMGVASVSSLASNQFYGVAGGEDNLFTYCS